MMIDFTKLTREDMQKLKKINKATSFLDFMVKTVFVSTFIFAAVMVIFAWRKDWEQLAITVTERWFTVMVGELIVTGVIQIAKEVVQTIISKEDN
ncbi:hypothetical protein H8707_13950 [Tissierellaceae bacterium BX21]|uniref:Uncharacterized protein n=2 Tax=Paratissierella segnis TaxID=2763679 RepID=A0A926IM59_9FIRM|nr:hypothetical protein [Paratissierella segnis]